MSGTNRYIVADEYDWTGPYKNRTDANKECKRWRLEGRNAEVIRRVPKHLADRERAIMPRFYPPNRSLDQEAAHMEPIAPRWYERSLDDWDAPTYEQPKLRGWLEREPELLNADPRFMSEEDWEDAPIADLTMSPQDLWMEHRGWSA